MDKPLPDKEKEENSRTDDANSAAGFAQPASGKDLTTASIGAYGPNSTPTPDLSQKAWDKSKHAWSDTVHGRMAIRTVSRGILGAAFFTAGSLLTRKWMNSDFHKYDEGRGLFNQENPLQFIAKLIDMTAGKGIKTTVKALHGGEVVIAAAAAEKAVRFRHAKYGGGGRSLGSEMVHVTFDFFCASVGDAWGRDIAGWFDPNAKKSWMKNGKIDFPDAIKSSVKSLARYVTYNGGEDWAVALPYVYFMKASRHAVEKFSPGFVYDQASNAAGGSHKVDKHGNHVGNFNLEGIIDLQGRFTVYNMGTLMYREAYNYIGDKLNHKPASLYGAPDKKKPRPLEAAANFGKWIVRSVIKGGIYMTPAVPFFWITRTPQGKQKGKFINEELGAIGYEGKKKPEILGVSELDKSAKLDASKGRIKGTTPDQEVYFTRYDPGYPTYKAINGDSKDNMYIQNNTLKRQDQYGVLAEPFNPYGKTFNIADAGLNEIGKLNYRGAKKANTWADSKNNTKWGKAVKSGLGIKKLSEFSQTYVDAAVSYTPYMIAKAEFANAWDSGKTDLALERTIDAATHFNWGEFKAGAREVKQALMHDKFDDPAREAEAQRRIAVDETLSDASFRKSSSILDEDPATIPSWKDRLFHGKPAEKTETKPQKNSSHAEKESMRKALDELTPPTNSIH